MGEAARLGKIKALQAGITPTQQAGQPGLASPSGPGMAQALSAMGRQNLQTAQAPVVGGPEQLAQQMAMAGTPSTGGRLRVPGG